MDKRYGGEREREAPFSVECFLSHMTKEFLRRTLRSFGIFRKSKFFLFKMRKAVKTSCRNFSSDSTKELRMGNFRCFEQKTGTTKRFWIKRWGGGREEAENIKIVNWKNFRPHAESFSRETLGWFRKFRVSKTSMQEMKRGVTNISRIFLSNRTEELRMGKS